MPNHETIVVNGAVRCDCTPGKVAAFWDNDPAIRCAEAHQANPEKYPLTWWELEDEDTDNA